MQRDAQSRSGSLQRLYAMLLPIALFCWLATLGGVGGTPRNHNAPLDDGAPLVVVALKTMQDTQRLLQGIAQPWHVEGILRLPGALGGKGHSSSSSPGDGSSSSSSSRTSTGLHLRATLPLAWAVQRATAEHDAFSVADVRVFAVSFTYHRRTARDLAVPCSSGPLLATVPVEQLQRDNADAWALDMHFDEGALQDDRDDDAAEETEGLSSLAGPQGFVLSADDDLSQGNNYQDVPFPVGRYFVCAAVEVRTHPTSVHRHDDRGAAVERSAVPIASFDVFGWRIAGTPEEGPRRASVCTRRQHLGDVSASGSGVGRLSTSPVRCVIGLEGWFPFPDGAVVELRQGDNGDGDRALARRTTSFDAPWVSRVHLPVDTVVASLAVNGGDGTQWVDVVTERSGGHVEQSPIALTVRAYHRGTTARPLPPFGNGGAIVSNFSVSLPLLHLEVGGHVEVVDGMLDAPTADDVQHDDVDAPIPYNIRLVPQVNVASHPLLVIGSASGWVLELRIDAMECVEQSLGPCIALSQSAPPRHVPHALFHCPFDARGLWPSPPLDALEQQPGSLRLAAATIRCTTAAGVIVPIVVSELNDVDMHRTLVGGGGDGLLVVADPSTLRVWLYTLNHTIARAILAPSGISVVAMQSDTIRDGEPIGPQQAQGQSAVHEVAMPVHIENTTTTSETDAHGVEELRLSVFPWNHPWHHCSYLRVVVHGLPTAVDRYVPCGEFARRGRTVHAWPHAIRLATASAPQDAAPALIVGTIQRPGAPSHRADLLAEYSVRVQKHHVNVDQATLSSLSVTLTAHVAYVPATQTLRRSVSWDWSHWCGNSELTISRSTQLSTDAVGGEDAEHDWVWSVTGSPAGVPVHANALASGRAFAAFCFSAQYRLGVYQQLLLVPVILVATPTVAPLTASLTMPCTVDGAGGDGEDGGGMPTAALCTQCFPGARLVRAPLRPRYDARMTHAADVSAFYFCTPSADTGRRDDASLVASDVLDNAGTALMRFHRPSLEALGRSTAADRDARFGPFALCVTINVTALVARHRAVSSMWQAFGLLHIDQAPQSEPAAGASLVPAHFGFATFTGCPTVQAVAIPPPAPLSVDALSEAWWAFFPTNTVQLQRALDAVTKGTAARSTHPSLATMLSRHPLRIVPFPQSLSGRDYIKRYKTHRLCVSSASDHDASRRAAPVGNRRDAELLGDAVAQLYRTVRMEGAVGWLLRTRGPFYGDRALCANINGVEEYVGILSVPGPWYTAPLPMAPPNAAPIAEQARPSQLVFQRIVTVVDDPVRLSFSVVAHSSAEFLRSSLQLVRVEYIDQWGAILGAEQHVAPSAVGGDVLPDGNLDIVSPLHYEEVTRASVPSDVDRVVTATLVPHVPGTYVVCFAKGLAWDNTTKLVSGHQRSQPGKALAAAVRSTIERDASMEALFDRQDGAVGAKRDEGSAGLHRQQLLDSLGVAAILGINRTATTRLPTLSDVKVATILEVLPPTRYDDGGAIKIRQHGGRTHVVVSSIAVARFRGVVGWATACVAPSIANIDVEGAHHPPVDVDALSSYQGVAPARSMIHLRDGALQLGFVLSPSNLCGRSRIVLLAGWRRVARAVRTPYRNQHAQRASVGMDDTVDTQRVVWRIVTRDLELPRGVLDHIAMAHRRAPPGEGATNDMDPPPSRSSLAACGGGSDAEACTRDAGSHSSIESTELFDALDLDLLDGI